MFVVMVIIVSSVVQFYSLVYMHFDPNVFLFISYLNFFTFCMLILITASELGLMFIG